MVTVYGMSDRLGPISFDSSGHSIFIGRDFGQTKSYSEETAAIIDEEIKKIFDEASAKCEEILRAHADVLVGVAEYLLINETMDGADFARYCETKVLPEEKPKKTSSAGPEPTAPEAPVTETRRPKTRSRRRMPPKHRRAKPRRTTKPSDSQKSIRIKSKNGRGNTAVLRCEPPDAVLLPDVWERL